MRSANAHGWLPSVHPLCPTCVWLFIDSARFPCKPSGWALVDTHSTMYDVERGRQGVARVFRRHRVVGDLAESSGKVRIGTSNVNSYRSPVESADASAAMMGVAANTRAKLSSCTMVEVRVVDSLTTQSYLLYLLCTIHYSLSTSYSAASISR